MKEPLILNKMTNELKKFVKTISVILLILAAISYWRGHHYKTNIFIAITVLLVLIALINIKFIKPIYISWMKFSEILAIIMNSLILSFVFYIIFVPIGLILRIFRVDILDREIDKNIDSYWLDKKEREFNPKKMERMY